MWLDAIHTQQKLPLSHNTYSGVKRVNEKQRRPQHAGVNYAQLYKSVCFNNWRVRNSEQEFFIAATTTAWNKMNGSLWIIYKLYHSEMDRKHSHLAALFCSLRSLGAQSALIVCALAKFKCTPLIFNALSPSERRVALACRANKAARELKFNIKSSAGAGDWNIDGERERGRKCILFNIFRAAICKFSTQICPFGECHIMLSVSLWCLVSALFILFLALFASWVMAKCYEYKVYLVWLKYNNGGYLRNRRLEIPVAELAICKQTLKGFSQWTQKINKLQSLEFYGVLKGCGELTNVTVIILDLSSTSLIFYNFSMNSL